LFVFLAFLIAMVVMSIVGFAKGNYQQLVAGIDADGNICGNANDTSVTHNFPKTYYFLNTTLSGNNLAKGATCVKECPTSTT